MKRYYAFALVSAFLFLAATAFSATLLFELFFLAKEKERAILLALCLIFFIFSAAVQLIASGLALLGRFLAKRREERGVAILFTVMAILPIVSTALSYLLLLFA